MFIPFISEAQPSSLHYDIFYKTSKIGNMQINALREDSRFSIIMESNVEISFIISQTFKISEKALFENDKLIYSETKRTKSGTVTLDNQTKAIANNYNLKSNEENRILKVNEINYNFLMLYFKEPNNISSIYSDSFQCFLKIEKLNNHHFKIKLPNNDYNEYFYSKGVCSLVKIHTGFFNVIMKAKDFSK
ncbi:MAG: hypothetical protein H7098_01995 [Oligoflexus sp.]|nr:hypothetical protein [Pseudopedobacter sp.]